MLNVTEYSGYSEASKTASSSHLNKRGQNIAQTNGFVGKATVKMETDKISSTVSPIIAASVSIQIPTGDTSFNNNNNSYSQQNSNHVEPADMQHGQLEAGTKRKKGTAQILWLNGLSENFITVIILITYYLLSLTQEIFVESL